MASGTKLLISVISLQEARRCVRADGISILDVKNPQEGSLGGHSPRVIRKIREMVGAGTELSATIGDVINRPGWVAQAALGLAACGVDYIKFGLCDAFTPATAIALVREVVKTVRDTKKDIKVVVCGYADARAHGFLLPERIPEVVRAAGADVAMIDTLGKTSGRGLFDYLEEKTIRHFCRDALKLGLRAALAGSLKNDDLEKIRRMGVCDIIGIRSLACRGGVRNNAIEVSRIKDIKRRLFSRP